MQKLLNILLLMILPLTAVNAMPSYHANKEKDNTVFLGNDGNALPPYIIVINDKEQLPTISDDDILNKGITITFKVNSSRFATNDPGFSKLRYALQNIPSNYTFCRLLVLRGSASPDGPVENNKMLAHRRARALADSLSHYVTLPDSTIEERFINEDYDGLYNLVSASKNFKYKDRVLAEIGNSDNDAVIKERLKAIDGGKAWHMLAQQFFPKLRATRVVMVVSKNPATVQPEPVVAEPIVEKPAVVEQPAENNVAPDTTAILPPAKEVEETPEDIYVYRPWLAIKSNLLYDAALTPNIEIERWFGKNNHWSIMAEWNFPWWQWHNKERVYEVNEFGLELRHWFFKKPCPNSQEMVRDPETGKLRPKDSSNHWWLTGHFLALYVAGGYYDLEWRYHGEQGDIYSAGITYGYAVRLSRHWNMEFSASVGYLHSPYTHYEAEHHDNILFAKYKKNCNYFGPTKLKVSIVWLLGRTKKKN